LEAFLDGSTLPNPIIQRIDFEVSAVSLTSACYLLRRRHDGKLGKEHDDDDKKA
jgi:hypothetical protein